MRTIVIFEDDGFERLLPLTYWRTVPELRCGYDCLFDHSLRAARISPATEVHLWCRPELAAVAAGRFAQPVNARPGGDTILFVNARVVATEPFESSHASAVQWHDERPVVIQADAALAAQLTPETLLDADACQRVLAGLPTHTFVADPRMVAYPWDLVHANNDMLHHGWQEAGEPADIAGRICEGVFFLNKRNIHVGDGSTLKPGVVLDAEHGPIFIGRNVTVAANASIEGPGFIGDGSVIQAGANIREAVSIGRRCKVGGEVETSIIHGFSNKQHDGFLGHAYVGEWVNLAADTVCSDLKNTYGNIRVPVNGVDVDSGRMFVGPTIGDHSKTGIGQMFPTGAVVGFGSNVATCVFAPRFVPSFSWLVGEQPEPYDLERCLDVARRVMARRQTDLAPAEEAWFRRLPAYAARFEQAR